MSDSRPETDNDILSRGRRLSSQQAAQLRARGRSRRQRGGRYSMDLPAHMAECDANYLRLRKLFPALDSDDQRCLELAFGEARWQVSLQVVERSRGRVE